MEREGRGDGERSVADAVADRRSGDASSRSLQTDDLVSPDTRLTEPIRHTRNLDVSAGQSEDGVSVGQGVDRVERTCETVVRGACGLLQGPEVEPCIGRQHDQSGVPRRGISGVSFSLGQGRWVAVGVERRAEGVDDGESPDPYSHPSCQRDGDRCRTHTALVPLVEERGAGPGSHAAPPHVGVVGGRDRLGPTT